MGVRAELPFREGRQTAFPPILPSHFAPCGGRPGADIIGQTVKGDSNTMEYRRTVPVHSSWDLIVCGAGVSGIPAAVSAARMGLSVMCLERGGAVGGSMTMGHVTTVMGSVAPGTLRDEIARLIASRDASTGVNIEEAKGLLPELMQNSGVQFRLQAPVVDTLVTDGVIRGVYALTQSGLQLFEAKRVIDATGDGYVAAMAGCDVMVGREGDGLTQPVSLMYTIGGVDEDCALVCRHEEDWHTLPDGREYLAACKKAASEGRLPPEVTIVRLYRTPHADERLVNATQMNGVSVLRDGDAERSELALRRQIRMVNRFLREEIPGFANIYVRGSASALGVRESRRVRGRYVLEGEDLIAGRRFDDAVVHRADFPIDIHNPTGGGQSETDGCPYTAQPYDIPMRALQPLKVDNLILSGRCISGSHRAHASYRVMNIAMAVGQAAGTMAAVSLRDGVTVSALDYAHVRAALQAQGCVLSDDV